MWPPGWMAEHLRVAGQIDSKWKAVEGGDTDTEQRREGKIAEMDSHLVDCGMGTHWMVLWLSVVACKK